MDYIAFPMFLLRVLFFLTFGMACTSAALTAVFGAALFGIRTTNTSYTFFLFPDKVETDSTDDQYQYSGNNEVFHYA